MPSAQTAPVAGSVALVLALGAAALALAQMHKSDVEFCRDAFVGLAKGRPAAARAIEWGHLQALGVDVGAMYTALPNEEERAKYRQAFVKAFSQGFGMGGSSARDFTHWRLHGEQGARRVIAADYEAKRKTLLLSVPSSGARKLTAIEWQQ